MSEQTGLDDLNNMVKMLDVGGGMDSDERKEFDDFLKNKDEFKAFKKLKEEQEKAQQKTI